MQPQMSNNTCDIILCHYLSTKIKPKCGKLWEKPSRLLSYCIHRNWEEGKKQQVLAPLYKQIFWKFAGLERSGVC